MTPRLILASASEGRRDLLTRAGYEFEVFPSGVEEPPFRGFPGPRAYVQHVAWLKAEGVSSHISEGIIIAADSIAWLNGEVIGKPADRDDARRIIQALSGSCHELWTGVCLWRRPSDRQVCWQERSLVSMKWLTPAEVEIYLDTGTWVGKSGAYAIQDRDDPYVKVLEGSKSNVVGLPLESLRGALQDFAE
jgi:nucleoside triphosphate pyrophosphatase